MIVSAKSSKTAASKTIVGCQFRASTSPSANQHVAASRGARRNSSAGSRTAAFGQRSGFGPLVFSVFKALPADRTGHTSHHNLTTIICLKPPQFPGEMSEETYPSYVLSILYTHHPPTTLSRAPTSPDRTRHTPSSVLK